jgi:hypothetical protein
MVAGSEAPRWLPAHLEWWSQGVRYDNLVAQYRPSKLKTVERLLGVEQAVAILRRELEDPSIRNLLQAAKTSERIGVAITALKELSDRAVIARSSPALIGKSGKTKRGPGKPDVPDVFNAKALCAARIFEAWRFLNGREPGISNLKAAEAAQAYWLASGGTSDGYGDPLNGWYDHFRCAARSASIALCKVCFVSASEMPAIVRALSIVIAALSPSLARSRTPPERSNCAICAA